MKANKTKIYYIGGGKVVNVFKSANVKPTQWCRTLMTTEELYNEINYMGLSYMENQYKDNKVLMLCYKLAKNHKEFKTLLDQNEKINTFSKYSIEPKTDLNKSKGKLLWDMQNNKQYIILT